MILAYILIILLIIAVIYLYIQLQKVKSAQLGLLEKDNGEVVLLYNNQEIINYQLQKK